MSAELRLNAGDHASCSESARDGFLDKRPVLLLPHHLEDIRFNLPLDRETAGQRGERAILCRIGNQLMQGQSQSLRRRRLQLEIRTGVSDLIAGRLGCELLVDQLSDFRALPARQ